MRTTRLILLAVFVGVFLPTVAAAQSSIAGVVRDASGAVLPGVTVEAASPALIEKVRTATTDGPASTGSRISGRGPTSSRLRSRVSAQ